MSGGVVAANVPLHTMVLLFTRVAGAETFEYSSPALASTSIFTLASVPTKFSARTVQSVWLVVAKVVGVQSWLRLRGSRPYTEADVELARDFAG